ncbi:MAG: hypothetical protein WCP85_20720 [Mariniphaga sp.]
MATKEGISINFFAEGSYKLQLPGGTSVEVVQKTDYPVSGNITVKVLLPKDQMLKVRIRIPEWSKQNQLSVNGEPFANITPGSYAEISRSWKSGDAISLTADLRGRIVRIGERPENIAIVRGPIVLCRDARLGTPHVDETLLPVLGKEGTINLEPVAVNQDGIWMKFNGTFILESHQEGGSKPQQVTFCDFASAGNTLDEQSWFRVWLPQSYDPRR